MKKTREQYLEEATTEEIEWTDGVVYVPKHEALEAMRLFGKQCFAAGHNVSLITYWGDEILEFNKYLKNLEEQK